VVVKYTDRVPFIIITIIIIIIIIIIIRRGLSDRVSNEWDIPDVGQPMDAVHSFLAIGQFSSVIHANANKS